LQRCREARFSAADTNRVGWLRVAGGRLGQTEKDHRETASDGRAPRAGVPEPRRPDRSNRLTTARPFTPGHLGRRVWHPRLLITNPPCVESGGVEHWYMTSSILSAGRPEASGPDKFIRELPHFAKEGARVVFTKTPRVGTLHVVPHGARGYRVYVDGMVNGPYEAAAVHLGSAAITALQQQPDGTISLPL
jgi:hypothetical protein